MSGKDGKAPYEALTTTSEYRNTGGISKTSVCTSKF